MFGHILPSARGGNATGGSADTASQVTTTSLVTEETISGGMAVNLSYSGYVRVAMASISGRMPAFGVTLNAATSGQAVTVYQGGMVQNVTSGTPWNFSGWVGRPLYVGISGNVIASGAPVASGNIQQTLGVVVSHSGILVELGDALQGVTLGSGDIGSGAIMGQGGGGFFNIASGTVTTNDLASGSFITFSRYQSVNNLFTTAELISGIKAVAIASGDGTTIVRAERQSGLRLPSIGVTVSGAASGLMCTVIMDGPVWSTASGMLPSGFHGRPLYVGSGGILVSQSGFLGVAPFLSGSAIQAMGWTISGGMWVRPERTPRSGLADAAGQGTF